MKFKRITISIPEDDYNDWQQYVKLYGSVSHFVREGIHNFIKLQDSEKRVGLLDVILEQRGHYAEIRDQLLSLKETMLQKRKVDDILKLKTRVIKYLRKFDQASDEELLEWLEIDEDELLNLTSILVKQNLLDLVNIRNEYYWVLKEKKRRDVDRKK